MAANSTLLFHQTTRRGNATAKPHEFEFCPGVPNAKFETLDSSAPYFVNAAFNVSLAIATSFANLLVLLAMRHVTSIRLPSKLLLCSLVVTDLGAGLVVQPQFAALLFTQAIYPGRAQCALGKSFGFTSCFFYFVSFCMLTVISLDRYAALFFHLKYQQIMTTRRVCVILAFVWSFSLFVASTNDQLWKVLTLTVNVVNYSVVSVACIKIYRRLRAHQVQPQAPDQAQQLAGSTPNMERYRRTATAMMWVYVLFLVSYVPQSSLSLVEGSMGNTTLRECLKGFTFTLMQLNSCLNPFVYCLRLPEIRTKVMKQLRKLCCPSSQQ